MTKKLFYLLFITVILSSCGLYNTATINNLQLGMTKEEVDRTYGLPDRLLTVSDIGGVYQEVYEYRIARSGYALEFRNNRLARFDLIYEDDYPDVIGSPGYPVYPGGNNYYPPRPPGKPIIVAPAPPRPPGNGGGNTGGAGRPPVNNNERPQPGRPSTTPGRPGTSNKPEERPKPGRPSQERPTQERPTQERPSQGRPSTSREETKTEPASRPATNNAGRGSSQSKTSESNTTREPAQGRGR